jgi:hypothetical protein
MAESLIDSSGDVIDWTSDGTYLQGVVIQLYDGRAGIVKADCVSGNVVGLQVRGVAKSVAKTASQVWIKGAPIWWDHSANTATCNEPIGAGDRDFYLGVATADALAAATTGGVNLNVLPSYIIDSARDNGDTALVKTVVGSTTVEVPQIYNRGGMIYMQFGTTAEAQQVGWISDRSFTVSSNWVAEILFELVTAADNAAVDIDVGVASAIGTTDFEAVAEFAAFHMDGDDLVIDAHSDDGTTDVAPTTTTLSIAAGTPVRFTLDGRDVTNVKYYINGVEVNAGTTNMGVLTAATGPLFAVVTAEKTSDDSPLAFRVRHRVRTMQAD